MNPTGDRIDKNRLVTIASVVAIVVGVIASVVIVLARGDTDTSARVAEVTPRSDPHAKRAVPKEILNAVDKITLTADRAQLVARGRELFRSSDVALDGESCQSCHTDGGANAEVGTTPHGVPGPVGQQPLDQSFVGPRDPQTLFGVGTTDPYFWIGDVATLQEISVATIQNHFKPQFKDNNPPNEVADQAAFLTAYMETIKAPTTAFDRGTMSPDALAGLELFQGEAGCVACHGGPNFTDGLEHNTFVPQAPPMFSGAPANNDPGRQAPPTGTCRPDLPLDPLQPLVCAFNTPTLRGIGLPGTAPFMHNGFCGDFNSPGADPTKCDTLAEVVRFYDTESSVRDEISLNAAQQAQLVEFLKSL